jgi:TonB family protein
VLALMFALAVSPSDVGRNNPAAWNWVRDSQICTLRQQINSAGDTVKVSRTPGNDETAIEISQKSQLNLRDRQVPTGAIKLNPGGDVPAEVYQHTADRRLHVYAVTQDPNFVEKFSHAVSLGISDGSSTAAAISLGFPAAAADALRSCEDEKMRAWGIDATMWRALRSHPVPIGSLRDRFSSLDYPSDALTFLVTGDAVTRLDVGPDGAVKECHSLNASQYKGFEYATCQVLKGARFKPATESSGNAVAAPYVLDVIFRIAN